MLLVVLFAGFIFRSLRITRKQKTIIELQKLKVDEAYKELNQQNIEILAQRNEIEKQKKLIEEHQKEIVDSITYAKRIQTAKLPRLEEVYSCLPQSFILFKPKDIVSGDFYFFHNSNNSRRAVHRGELVSASQSVKIADQVRNDDDVVIIAAADCTGHGVPGAFMSMIGSERLEDAVLQTIDTSEILKHLNIGIKTSLRQSDSEESTRDGMDIALVSLKYKVESLKLEKQLSDEVEYCQLKYAGANRPLWIIRNGKEEIEETKATKKAIGGLTEDDQHFESHELKLQQGDTFYLFSDGYSDQFNSKDKKLMTKKFKEILLSIQNKSMEEQKEFLNTFIEDWKQNTEQTDDILVIGVRV